MKKQNYTDILPKNISLKVRIFILLGLLFLISGIDILTKMPAKAQETNTNSANKTNNNKQETPKETPKNTPELPSLKDVQVTAVNPTRGGINNIIELTVANLKSLKNYADCKSDDGKQVSGGCTKQDIALFLNGREIKGISYESIKPETTAASEKTPSEGTVAFHLNRSSESDEAWADLLGNPPFNSDFFDRKDKVTVSVGLKNSYALGSQFNEFTLVRAYKDIRFWAVVILLILLIIAVFYLALYTNLLRDVGPSPKPEPDPNAKIFKKKIKRKPYSLARTQMAFWFIMVIWAFLFIWLITGAFDTITATTLALIGIGAGTALGAAVIDINKNTDGEVERLRKEKEDLQKEITDLEAKTNAQPPPNDLVQLQTNLKEKNARLKTIDELIAKFSTEPKVTEGFLLDILTDPEGGISFHRFQMFVWTIVLGILFLYSVWNRLSMPEFSGTLLALLGISAGTYLGFKIPENNSAPPAGQ